MDITFSNETINRLGKELKIAEKLGNITLYKIVHCLFLIGKQYSIESISEILNISTRTIYNWRSSFLIGKFSWLLGFHYVGRGRKPKLNKDQKEKLYNMIDKGPLENGFDCGVWNSAMIVILIEREFKVTYNPRYVCYLLKTIGITYQKAKFIPAKLDEEALQKKRQTWKDVIWPEILKKSNEINAVILFGDEVSFAQWGSLAKTWAPRGKQPTVKTCGQRKGLKMFGCIEFKNGHFEYMECDGKFNGESYIKFLEKIMEKYSCPVILIEDGASYHGSKLVKEFKQKLEDVKRLFVYRLPSYSPDKNPIEKLWKNTKKDATHLVYFPKFEDLRKAVINAFEKYLSNALKVICVMKKLRTEAGIA